MAMTKEEAEKIRDMLVSIKHDVDTRLSLVLEKMDKAVEDTEADKK